MYRDYLFFMGSKDQKDINVYNQQIYNNVLKYLNYNLWQNYRDGMLLRNILDIYKLFTRHFSVQSDTENMAEFLNFFLIKDL